MPEVKIVVLESHPGDLEAWGEVKAMDQEGRPTVAHVVIARGGDDVFDVPPGRYSLHFRVARKGTLVLSTKIDGKYVGPPDETDATRVTAGLRYNFAVPQ